MTITQTLPYFIIFLLFILTTTPPTKAQPFSCKPSSKCNSLIDYVSPNDTTISNITTLFGISKNLLSFLGANNYPPTTLPSLAIKAKQTVKIPFPCRCANGTGTSDGLPVYKVVPEDGLFHIASDIFGGLVLYQQIQAANNIADANKILVGQELKIPLPCSCDEVDGQAVIHYGHVVPAGSSVEAIAKQFDTTQETLLKLNALADPADLKAGVVLDVPLKACNSSISSDSRDYPLLVPNGSYAITANNCVRCKCDAANNYTLQCEPSQIKSSIWPTCPNTQCNSVFLGNSTSSGCSRTTCAYLGYDNQKIITNLTTVSTCSSNSTPSDSASPSSATKINSQGWRWNFLVAVQLVLLSLYLFQ
ncbi:lysM domain-containing GPI-anchored protein 2 [Daucus carota subsp. sativus]|uniref:lysM domain-containing GPI-anchored protein 2 n=1 Tax=Daucus carota subsp. sativus TaxID=79200 RepID=UPI0007F00C9D|nr:PREDICTED: lysM domain-containing GPI-anchored protein 2 [Daucus carota subsp. sativus]